MDARSRAFAALDRSPLQILNLDAVTGWGLERDYALPWLARHINFGWTSATRENVHTK